MTHWLLESAAELRATCLEMAMQAHVQSELGGIETRFDLELLRSGADALELSVIDLIASGTEGEGSDELKSAAADAFRIARCLPLPEDGVAAGQACLRASCLAVIGDRGADASRWLESNWPTLDLDSADWRRRTWSAIVDVWLRLVRKSGWGDRDAVLLRISALRDAQAEYEGRHLGLLDSTHSKAAAYELIGLYHLAKAAEVLAKYITDGQVEGKFQIHGQLQIHFDRVAAACQQAQMLELEPLSQLLSACASQLAENSIWTVTRAANSRVTKFVETLVDRGRADRAIFDVLPPQRRALAEKGLLGSSRRAVVVSLPTSSGKTLIAEFRALQALNQFEHERGWVAYLAPTRTLVSQVARQLRRDLGPVGVVVEQVSPALQVDNVETVLLTQQDREKEFRILVTTPEKLDLMLRQDLEETIGRPLTLVIVDEAHNLQDEHRGLRLELLLATINSECKWAQFLLLTPFIHNAREVARWLGGNNSDDISLAVDWQPNNRVIGVVHVKKGSPIKGRSFDYSVEFETVHTTRQTLTVDDAIPMKVNHNIAPTYGSMSSQAAVAAVAAHALRERGPVIVMHTRPDHVWALAKLLKAGSDPSPGSDRRSLAQDFLRLEYGTDFPLIDLVKHGIGVHHAGLSDDVRGLMEWLFERGELRFLAATTTIAQGVNFPVSAVVMASHQYPYGTDMPPDDFWNIAGRTGRIGQGELGVVALAASDEVKATALRSFINKSSGDLNSALIALAIKAGDELGDLGHIVYRHPEWSTFVQYLTHTYRQMGMPDSFGIEIETVLRNTFGFAKLRAQHPEIANRLLAGVHAYAEYLQEPGQPLKLVDSTGFSLQSVKTVLAAAGHGGIRGDSWDKYSLFAPENPQLRTMMGVLLRVPELRENLEAVLGGRNHDSDKLARIVKDWVNGVPLPDIANSHFGHDEPNFVKALTLCGQRLSGKLIQTTAWGLGALLAITGGDLSEQQLTNLRNLPSQVFYGVDSDEAVALRLIGVPRMAAIQIAKTSMMTATESLVDKRTRLVRMTDRDWVAAYGTSAGSVYRSVWRVLEGVDD